MQACKCTRLQKSVNFIEKTILPLCSRLLLLQTEVMSELQQYASRVGRSKGL